jgi:phosphatidylglycerophosphate synthase
MRDRLSKSGNFMQAAPAFARRPIRARNSRWAAASASLLARRGVAPNTISCASVAFAALAGVAFLALRFAQSPYAQAALFVAAIGGIQGRLVCNLLDGMVAIEGGRKTMSGDIFNDLPDRISDPLIIVPAGYAITSLPFGPGLGWLAAVAALLTAYVRVLGHSAGAPDFFAGPMAKQHRMAVLTLACALCAPAAFWGFQQVILYAALMIAAVGGAVTVIRRVMLIIRALEHP